MLLSSEDTLLSVLTECAESRGWLRFYVIGLHGSGVSCPGEPKIVLDVSVNSRSLLFYQIGTEGSHFLGYSQAGCWCSGFG